jgi:hypothetical protein
MAMQAVAEGEAGARIAMQAVAEGEAGAAAEASTAAAGTHVAEAVAGGVNDITQDPTGAVERGRKGRLGGQARGSKVERKLLMNGVGCIDTEIGVRKDG